MQDVTEKKIHVFKEDIVEFLSERLERVSRDAEVCYCLDGEMHYIASEDDGLDSVNCIVVKYYEIDDADGSGI